MDFTSNLLNAQCKRGELDFLGACPSPPLCYPEPRSVEKAARQLMFSKRPLVIIGKGNKCIIYF